jgi:hypothetical protein
MRYPREKEESVPNASATVAGRTARGLSLKKHPLALSPRGVLTKKDARSVKTALLPGHLRTIPEGN